MRFDKDIYKHEASVLKHNRIQPGQVCKKYAPHCWLGARQGRCDDIVSSAIGPAVPKTQPRGWMTNLETTSRDMLWQCATAAMTPLSVLQWLCSALLARCPSKRI